jgi:surfactin synthase thioesterase subunit
MVHEAYTRGEFDLGWQLVMIAAEIRRKAQRETTNLVASAVPEALHLTRTATQPRLICFPALAAPTGPIQYARFAEALRGRRDVSVLSNPGFQRNGLLPADRQSVVRGLAEAVKRTADGRPFGLVGLSSGGLMAHAVGAELERSGLVPNAIVLLDTYPRDALSGELRQALQRAWVDWMPSIPRVDDELTAMSHYIGLFADWTPAHVAAPTLLVRPVEPFQGVQEAGNGLNNSWRSYWQEPCTMRDAPGNHFTMLEQYAEQAARVVHEWLEALGQPAVAV